MSCNRVCFVQELRFAKDPSNGGMYAKGFVNCNECSCFLDPIVCKKNKKGALICPCCFRPVRTTPRAKHNRLPDNRKRIA